MNLESNLTQITIEKFNSAFNLHDVNGIMDLMTHDCLFENTYPVPDGTRIEGTKAVRAHWEKFFENNPDAFFETEEIFTAGSRGVVRWIYRKKKEGKDWHLRGVDIFKVEGDKVAEKLSYVKG